MEATNVLSLRSAAQLLALLIHPPTEGPFAKEAAELAEAKRVHHLLRVFDAIRFAATVEHAVTPPAQDSDEGTETETRYDNSVLDGLKAASELGIEAGNMPLPQLLSQALRHAVNQIREERESNLCMFAGLIEEMRRYSFDRPASAVARDLCIGAVQSARLNRKALYSASHPVVNVEV